MVVIVDVLIIAVWLFVMVLLARVVIDWVQVLARDFRPTGVVLVLFEAVYTVTDPPLRAIRRVLPPLRIGPVALDLGTLLLFLGIWLIVMPALSALRAAVS